MLSHFCLDPAAPQVNGGVRSHPGREPLDGVLDPADVEAVLWIEGPINPLGKLRRPPERRDVGRVRVVRNAP